MFCGKCGSELATGVEFCTKCGTAVNIIAESKTNNLIGRKRHGFTSFWMIFMLALCIINAIFAILSRDIAAILLQGISLNSSERTQIDQLINLSILLGIFFALPAIGIIFLMRWKKIGFWVFIGTYLTATFVSIVITIMTYYIMENAQIPNEMELGLQVIFDLSRLVLMAITWGVLFLRKDGKTTWAQLN